MRTLGIGFLCFGLLFVGVALLVSFGARVFGGHSAETEGVVVDYRRGRSDSGNTMYAPVVKYRPPGSPDSLVHVPSGRTSWRPYDIGEVVDVRYHPDEPGRASIDEGPGLFGWIFTGFGLLFGGLGVGMLVQPVLRKRTTKDLRQNGRRVMAEVTAVDYDDSLVVNGRSPFRIWAQWHDEGANVMRVFDSDAIWYDPIEFVKPGDKIAVYFDRRRPSRYVVDLAGLPKLAE